VHGRRALRIGIFAAEVAFIVGVAVVAALEHLGWWSWLPVLGGWALVALGERLVWGRTQPAPTRAVTERVEPEAAPEPDSHVRVLVREERRPVAEPPPREPEPAPEPQSEPMPVAEAAPPAVEETAQEPQAAPAPEPEPEPRPEPVVLAAVPEPEPEPELVAPAPPEEPVPARAAQQDVVQLAPRGPREWNIWDLERLSREHAGADAFRDEERSYLLVYLREFANADGVLPLDFDGLVRESFGDLVGIG